MGIEIDGIGGGGSTQIFDDGSTLAVGSDGEVTSTESTDSIGSNDLVGSSAGSSFGDAVGRGLGVLAGVATSSGGQQTMRAVARAVGAGNGVTSSLGSFGGLGVVTNGTAPTGASAAATVNPNDIAAQQERMFMLQTQISAITLQYTTLSNCQASADRCTQGIAGNVKG